MNTKLFLSLFLVALFIFFSCSNKTIPTQGVDNTVTLPGSQDTLLVPVPNMVPITVGQTLRVRLEKKVNGTTFGYVNSAELINFDDQVASWQLNGDDYIITGKKAGKFIFSFIYGKRDAGVNVTVRDSIYLNIPMFTSSVTFNISGSYATQQLNNQISVTTTEYRSNGAVINGVVNLTTFNQLIVQVSGNTFTPVGYGEADLVGNYTDADGNDHPYSLHVLAVEPNLPFPVFTTNVAFNISGSYATQQLGTQMSVTTLEYRSNGTIITGVVNLTSLDATVQVIGNLFTVLSYGEAYLFGNYTDADGNDHPYSLHVLAVEPNLPFPVFTTNVAFNISGSYATQQLGNPVSVTTIEYRSNGTIITGVVNLTSSNQSIVQVSGNTFTPVGYGEADLVGNYTDVDGNDHPYSLHVLVDSPILVFDLQLLVEPSVVYTQQIPYSESYEVYLLKSDGSRESVTSQVSVTTSNSSVATASSGIIAVSSFSQSAVHITYSHNGMSTKTTVIAVEPNQMIPVFDLQLLVEPSVVYTQQIPYSESYEVYLLKSDGSRESVTSQVSVTTSNSSVATAANGNVTISAFSSDLVLINFDHSSGLSTKLPLLAIEPNQTMPVVCLGLEVQPNFFYTKSVPYSGSGSFTVKQIMSDGSRVNVTNTVSYSSSDELVATAVSGVVTITDFSEEVVYITVSDGMYEQNITVLSLEPTPEYIAQVNIYSQPDSVWAIGNGMLVGQTNQNELIGEIRLNSETEIVLITGRKNGYYDYSIEVELTASIINNIYLNLNPIITNPNISCSMIVDLYDGIPNTFGLSKIKGTKCDKEYEINVLASDAYTAVLQIVSKYGTETYIHTGGTNELWYSGPYSYHNNLVLFYLTIQDSMANKAYAVSIAEAEVILNFNP